MQQSITSILSLTDIFDTLTPTQLELIASICVFDKYPKGQVLLEENEDSDELYVIGRGGVEILMNPGVVGGEDDQLLDPVFLTELRQGQVFGEVALVDQGHRSATVKISQDETQLLRIPRERLMLLCDTYPEMGYKLMKNLAADLAFKIRNTDLTIRQYQLLLSQSKKNEN
ncbi:MAG: cyclic nucleotide-binding domain-containing protein [Chloroflexi bacterium]|nr:cyclic nucleotide-binding domain-containing protein [Chloroflexota bacterium]